MNRSPICLVSRFCPEEMRPTALGLENYVLVRDIGAGFKSNVHMARHTRSGTIVAFKRYLRNDLDSFEFRQIEREVEVHAGLSHENILHLYAAFEDAEGITLVLEFCAEGDLFALKRRWGGCLSEAQAVTIVVQPLVSVLAFLHEEGILHRDLKPENILFDNDMRLKLADFGLCCDLSVERPVTRCGTLDFMSPELLHCPRPDEHDYTKDLPLYNGKIDVWAVGILAYELLHEEGQTPFNDTEVTMTVENILFKEVLYPASFSSPAVSFLSACLRRDPNLRPTAAQLLAHAWLGGYRRAHRTASCTALTTLPQTQNILQHAATFHAVLSAPTHVHGPALSSGSAPDNDDDDDDAYNEHLMMPSPSSGPLPSQGASSLHTYTAPMASRSSARARSPMPLPLSAISRSGSRYLYARPSAVADAGLENFRLPPIARRSTHLGPAQPVWSGGKVSTLRKLLCGHGATSAVSLYT